MTAPPARHPAAWILVIEDDVELADVVSHALRRKGYSVLTARTGREGLQKAVSALPDLVVLDLSLPDISGSTVLDVFRFFSTSAMLPVVVVTGLREPDLSVDILALGADYYFTKPFSMAQLLMVIERRLSVARHTPVPPAPRAGTLPALTGLSFVSALMQWLETHSSDSTVTASTAARDLAVSLSVLHRRIRELLDTSFLQLLTNYRMAHARRLIDQGARRMTDVAAQVGVPHPPHFSKLFRRKFGVTPKYYALSIRAQATPLRTAPGLPPLPSGFPDREG